MPKVMSNPRFVLTYEDHVSSWVAASEGNGTAEFKRLKTMARKAVQAIPHAEPPHLCTVRIYLCMDNSPSSANLLTDLEVAKWRKKSE
jgi:hypothetical protein